MVDLQLQIATNRSLAVSTRTQVLASLRFYAIETFQCVVADNVGPSQSCVFRIGTNVTEILAETARTKILWLQVAAVITATMKSCASTNFPRVLAPEEIHIPIMAPHEDEHIYVNWKHFHSLNVQIICDSK